MFLAVAGLATFGASCSSSDDNGNGGGGKTALVAKASPSTVEINKDVKFSATADGKAVDGVKFYNEGKELTNPHKFAAAGEYKVIAKKNGFDDSAAITVKVTEEGVTPEPEEKKLTLLLSSEAVDLGEAVTFTVLEGAEDVSTVADILVNGSKISGTSYTADKAGEYTVVAKKTGAKDSDAQKFTVTEPIVIPEGGFIAMNDVIKAAGKATVTVDVEEDGKPVVYNLNGTLVTVWEFLITDQAGDNVSKAVFGLSLLDGDTKYGFPGDAGVSYTLLTSSVFKFNGVAIDLATEFKSFEGIALPSFQHPDFDGGAVNNLEYLSVFGLSNDRTFVTSFNDEFDFEVNVIPANTGAKASKGIKGDYKLMNKNVKVSNNVRQGNFQFLAKK